MSKKKALSNYYEDIEILDLNGSNKYKIIIIIVLITLLFLAVIAFLIINYINKPYIELVGKKSLIHTVGLPYKDKGYVIRKQKRKINVKTETDVDEKTIGKYQITYNVYKDNELVQTITRKIKVADNVGPTIEGKDSVDVRVGTDIKGKDKEYFFGLASISIKDNYDSNEDLMVWVDTSNIDEDKDYSLDKETSYIIIIKATDKANNTTLKKVKINLIKTKLTTVKFSSNDIKLYVKGQYKINVEKHPADAYYNSLVWKSNDNNIATVNEQGVVFGISKGKTTICAFVQDNEEVKDCAAVTVEYSAIQKLISYITQIGFKKESNNVYVYSATDYKYTFDFNNKMFFYSNNISTLNYFYNQDYSIYDEYNIRVARYYFKDESYFCEEVFQYGVCYNQKGSDIIYMNTLKNYFMQILNNSEVKVNEL